MSTLHPTVEQARALLELERYDQAGALLGRRLAEDPGDIRAWVSIGYCHLNTDRAEQAKEAAAEALKLDPEDYGALRLSAQAMVRDDGWLHVQPVLRELIRIAPQDPFAYAMLADAVWRAALVRYAKESGARQLSTQDIDRLSGEAAELAMEALRLGPEDVYVHEIAHRIASMAGNGTVAQQLDEAILRIDPTHAEALARQTKRAAEAPGVGAGQAADLYADALAADPGSPVMRQQLDHATYRLLRGTRWLAVICVLAAGAMVNLFPSADDPGPELPIPVGQRLWVLVVMAAIWTFGAVRRYRRLRAGVQLNVRSLIRRGRWARIVMAQAAWAMLCALLIAEIPWTDRSVPQLVFWAGLVPTAATIWFDRKKTG
ncbi:tetratricopeptide repeat protein [Streptomyces formicae]|uniref:TPR repeat n=1 Tax=Streptomyces formicae TaxID=1616117 RepID=A0A291QN81_9ACTN|nr:tetratricopeptide repeat protein [Streptomyces formicae]ATL32976.1 TPR repeat [Streptomyces formicae]